MGTLSLLLAVAALAAFVVLPPWVGLAGLALAFLAATGMRGPR